MHVLLPIKNLNFAKQRLSSVLSPLERRHFFQAMLQDVLQVLSAHELIEQVTIISDDPSTNLLTEKFQLNCIRQASLNTHGLSDSIQAGVSLLAQNDIRDVMVLHGDLPLISASEVSMLLHSYHSASTPSMVLTPDRRGSGTNCIVGPSQTSFQFQYGENSFDKHCAQAEHCGLQALIIEQQGISCDIDYPHDLLQFLAQVRSDNALNTQRFLSDNNITNRLLTQPVAEPTSRSRESSVNILNFALKQSQKNYAT